MPYYSECDTPERRSRRAAVYSLEMRMGLLPALRLLGRSTRLPFGARERLVSFFCRPEYSSSVPFEIDFFGLNYPGDLSRYLDWCVYFFGAYEENVLLLLKNLLQEGHGEVFVDIGANVGQHTLFMSKWARAVHAFEPWDSVRVEIEQKIKRNQLTNITVHPVGIGEKHDWLPYYAPLGANTGTGSFDKDHAVDRNRLLGNLELVNGDEYFEAKGISKVDLIKIDAEGWEQFVLTGLHETLARWKPKVLMEVSESTLKNLDGPEKLQKCIPDCYDAVYADFTRRGVKYTRFDGSRAGGVLLLAS